LSSVSGGLTQEGVKGTSGGGVGESAAMLVASRSDKMQVSEFKSNILGA